MNPRILGVDSALRYTGWAVVELTGKQPESMVAFGCIETKKERQDTSREQEYLRRVAEITQQLLVIRDKFNPSLIVAELIFGSQGNSSAVARGIGYGIFGTLKTVLQIPVVTVTPFLTKKAVCGQRHTAKTNVQQQIITIWPEIADHPQREHIADALAAIVALRSDNFYLLLANRGAE